MPHTEVLALIKQGTASAVKLGLTAYDSAYVDLAIQEVVLLATLDQGMRKAATAAGVKIFTP